MFTAYKKFLYLSRVQVQCASWLLYTLHKSAVIRSGVHLIFFGLLIPKQMPSYCAKPAKKYIFLFCTYKTVSITLKRVSKRSSFRYAFQEHLLKFLMLAVTDSELLLRDHCTSCSDVGNKIDGASPYNV
jgi:hypothetical protein